MAQKSKHSEKGLCARLHVCVRARVCVQGLQNLALSSCLDILCSGSCIFHERRLPVKVIVEFSNEETPALFITYNCMYYQLFAQVSAPSPIHSSEQNNSRQLHFYCRKLVM